MQDQLAALEEIREFLKSGNEKVFILQGTSLSGKSHLIPYIKDIAFDEGIPEVSYLPHQAEWPKIFSRILAKTSIAFIHTFTEGPFPKMTK